jgi:toxin ParE1/3/4
VAVTFGNIRQLPQSGCVPAELADSGGLNFREMLSDQNRAVNELPDDTIDIHVVTDTRRDLQTLLLKRLLRSRW